MKKYEILEMLTYMINKKNLYECKNKARFIKIKTAEEKHTNCASRNRTTRRRKGKKEKKYKSVSSTDKFLQDLITSINSVEKIHGRRDISILDELGYSDKVDILKANLQKYGIVLYKSKNKYFIKIKGGVND